MPIKLNAPRETYHRLILSGAPLQAPLKHVTELYVLNTAAVYDHLIESPPASEQLVHFPHIKPNTSLYLLHQT